MAKQRKKLLIVDGYNVLRSGSRYRNAPDEDYTDDTFNAAREMLINDVVNYAGGDYKAVIVFDGAKNAFSNGEAETVGGVRRWLRRIRWPPASTPPPSPGSKLSATERAGNRTAYSKVTVS